MSGKEEQYSQLKAPYVDDEHRLEYHRRVFEEELKDFDPLQAEIVLNALSNPVKGFTDAVEKSDPMCPSTDDIWARKDHIKKLKPTITGRLGRLFEKLGITEVDIVTAIRDALTAEKVKMVKGGKTVNMGPDHSIRLKAANMLIQLGGYNAPTKHDVEVSPKLVEIDREAQMKKLKEEDPELFERLTQENLASVDADFEVIGEQQPS